MAGQPLARSSDNATPRPVQPHVTVRPADENTPKRSKAKHAAAKPAADDGKESSGP